MKFKLLSKAIPLLMATFLLAGGRTEAETLYKYKKNDDGTYGYDTLNPVPFYHGSNELIDIPSEYVQEKHQFKSSWVATIFNLHFDQPTSETDFKAMYQETLKNFKAWNMNAMLFQIRPLMDSWYPSEINPWSEFLSGTQGVDPGYDPLAYMVEETHKAGMEYHAWLNPYRVTNTKITTPSMLEKLAVTAEEVEAMTIPEKVALLNEKGLIADNNYAVLHPDYVIEFDGKFILNPGIPAVRDFVVDSVVEIIENYDVDAIHFDDYFYPYEIKIDDKPVRFGDKDEDLETFETYNNGIEDIQEWRRENINMLVSEIRDAIDAHNTQAKTAVQFGISPFGIWEHKENNPNGSNTPTGSSKSNSDSIFADTYKWVKEETIDYLSPQIYWSFSQKAAPYGELARWWNNVAEGTRTQIYVGHANYKHVSNGGWDADWMNPDEIPNQLLFNMNYKNIRGSAFFSYNDLLKSDLSSLAPALQDRHEAKNQSIDLLQANFFKATPLVPAKPWLSQGPVGTPEGMTASKENNQVQLTWQPTKTNNERFYVIYAGHEAAATQKAENIVAKRFSDGAESYQQLITLSDASMNLYISAVDAAGVESEIVPLSFDQEEIDETTDITLSARALETLKAGRTLAVEPKLVPSSAPTSQVNWASENNNIATVDAEGNVTGVKAGTTKIVATTTNGLKASFTLRVTR